MNVASSSTAKVQAGMRTGRGLDCGFCNGLLPDPASRYHRPRSRLHHRQPLRAQRTGVGLVGRQRRCRAARRTARRSARCRRCDRRSTRRRRPARRPPSPPASSRASSRRSSARPRRRARDRSRRATKPRRSMSAPSCRSAKIARTPSARATSWPMTTPPSAGDSTTVGRSSRVRSAIARPSASACCGCCSTSAHCR